MSARNFVTVHGLVAERANLAPRLKLKLPPTAGEIKFKIEEFQSISIGMEKDKTHYVDGPSPEREGL